MQFFTDSYLDHHKDTSEAAIYSKILTRDNNFSKHLLIVNSNC